MLTRPRTQTKAAGYLKQKSTNQGVAADRKKTSKDDPPVSLEITIVPNAEQLISPMVGEPTNIPSEVPPTHADEHQDAGSSETQQRKLSIFLLFYLFCIIFFMRFGIIFLLTYISYRQHI